MTTITLLGAGGKMGYRITDNLRKTDYDMRYVEVSKAGLARLSQRGLPVTAEEEAVLDADAVIFAVPDVAISTISATVVPHMKPGAIVILLNPATAYLGELARRDDLAYFLVHPCHPALFSGEKTPEAWADHFGGTAARQAIVCALVQGSEEAYTLGEQIARRMYAPVSRAHKITLEQMGMLEHTMADVIGATCAVIMREAMDEAIRRGVPYEVARDFMLGHTQLDLAIVFGFINAPFSDATKAAIEWGKGRILQPEWRSIFEPEQTTECVNEILHHRKKPINQPA